MAAACHQTLRIRNLLRQFGSTTMAQDWEIQSAYGRFSGGGNKLRPREVMLLQRVPNRRNFAMGIQPKEGYQSVSDWTASYKRFMDRAAAQRHLANVERHIAAGRASVLRQQEIIGRFESAGGRRSETASIAPFCIKWSGA